MVDVEKTTVTAEVKLAVGQLSSASSVAVSNQFTSPFGHGVNTSTITSRLKFERFPTFIPQVLDTSVTLESVQVG